jgi:hypothetical protein
LNPDPGSDTKEDDQLYSNNDFFDINNIDQLNINDGEGDEEVPVEEAEENGTPGDDHVDGEAPSDKTPEQS